MAEYVVLKPTGELSYEEVARIDAGSPAHAIELAVETEGDFIAVPLGKFQLMRVEPRLSFKVIAAQ